MTNDQDLKKTAPHSSHIAHAKEHIKSNPHMLIWIFLIIAIIVAIVFYFFI